MGKILSRKTSPNKQFDRINSESFREQAEGRGDELIIHYIWQLTHFSRNTHRKMRF